MLHSVSARFLVLTLTTFTLLTSTSPLPYISDSNQSIDTVNDTLTIPVNSSPIHIYEEQISDRSATDDAAQEIRAAEVIIAEAEEDRAAVASIAALNHSPGYYSTVIAFGASYTDNAHARASQYSGSLRNYWPFTLYGGRYANGPVAVEQIVDPSTSPPLTRSGNTNVVLQDYAYGGSMIDNNIAGSNYPATKDQVAQYLSDVAGGAVNLGSGRVLHYLNSGVNPVTAIWLNAMGSGFSASAKSQALASVTANINSLQNQYRSINTNTALSGKNIPVDYIMVGIPPLEIVPTFYYQANGDANALAFLKVLASAFNSQLAALAVSFRTEIPIDGKVFHFDLASLFYSMNSSPSSYGLSSSVINTPCFGSSLCSNVAGYMYWDSLHPTTFVHGIMASKMNALINSGVTTS